MYNPPIPLTTFFSLYDDTPSPKPDNNFPTIYIPGKQVLMSLDKELDLICFTYSSVIAVGKFKRAFLFSFHNFHKKLLVLISRLQMKYLGGKSKIDK